MQLNFITLKGIGPYKGKVSVNIDALAGELTAIVGENGSGKSTLIEAGFAGAAYRETPTRGTLKSLALGRDSLVESVITNGNRRYTVRHLIDGVSGKAEAVVMDEHGNPLNVSGKLPEYDSWAAAHFLSPDVFYATIFTPQAFTGFLGMKRGERKELLVQQLGIEKYERYAAQARDHARTLKRSLDQLEARISELTSGDTIASAEAQKNLDRYAAEVADLTARLESKRSLLSEREQRLRDLQLQVRDRERAQQDLEKAQTELIDIEERISNNETLLSNKESILAAVDREKELPGLIEDAQEQSRSALTQQQTCAAVISGLQQSIGGIKRSRTSLAARISSIEARMKRKSEIDEAKTKLTDAETGVREYEQLVQEAEAEKQRLAGMSLASEQDRSRALREGHEKIKDSRAGAPKLREISRGCIESDDQLLKLSETLPVDTKRAQETLDDYANKLRDAQSELRRVENILLLESDLIVAGKELEDAQHEDSLLSDSLSEQLSQLATANDQQPLRDQELSEADDLLRRLREEQRQVSLETKHAAPLSNAEARLAELREKSQSLTATISDLTISLSSPLESLPDLTSDRADLTLDEDALRNATAAVALWEKNVADARAREERLNSLNTEAVDLRNELADWTLLSESYGKDGLQALKIDAAGPQLSEDINDLLRSCIGPRWTVSIETTRMTADNKKQLEGCDIVVADNEVHRIASGESLSGGQKVIIGEAISLALTRLACRRNGIVGATLVRDESGAALSPLYAPAYVQMLRRAGQMLQASRVIFVSHNVECQELADSKIIIQDGQVTVK